MNLGRVGVWSRWLREADLSQRIEGCAELESLGYGTLWLPGVAGGDDFRGALDVALNATSHVVVASGILNIWAHDAHDVARMTERFQDRFDGRFLLGLGVSHSHLIPGRYSRPLDSMNRYLDVLDEYEATDARHRCLAALGPKMVALAGERSLGAHPYNVTVRHTAETRRALGAGPLLAPEQVVVVNADPQAAFALAHGYTSHYVGQFENYDNSFRRLGYSDADLEQGGSDRLVRDLVALGAPSQIATRIHEHHSAGADHVCLQVWNGIKGADPRAELRSVAEVVGLAS